MSDKETLRARIALLRRALEESDDPEIGFIALPSTHRTFPQEIPRPYQEFLREADGLACGVVLLYESDDILKHQAPAKTLPGGRQRWFCIGSAGENPLFLEARMNAVFCMNPEEEMDSDGSLGDLDYFLLNNVFGKGYEEFVEDSCGDRWLEFLEQTKEAHS
jgi:hypothetical protein